VAFASVYGGVLVMTSATHQAPGRPGTRSTNLFVDNTDKNLGSDLPLRWRKFGQLFLGKIIKIAATRCQIF